MLEVLMHLFRRLLGLLHLSARVRLTLPSNPRVLTSLDQETGEKKRTTLLEVLERCPSLFGGSAWYTPTSWLSSGHLATIYCTLAAFDYDHLIYSRELILTPDGGQLGLDFTPPITEEDPIDSRPILVIAHGLTGGSHESYVRDVLSKVTRGKEEGGLGWRGVVVNSRGCAGVECTNKVLYNGGVTNDLRCALTFLSHYAPQAPLYGAGFSLGANQMAKLIGQDGESTPLKAGIILGAPWNFVDGHVFISSSWLQLVYSRAMATNLRRLLARQPIFKDDERLDYPAIYGNPHQTLYEFDSVVTAPLGGFPSATAYYRWAGADQHIHNVAVPLLTFSAADDPIVAATTVPHSAASTNPNLIFAETKHGGHLGWFQGFFRPRRWISTPVLEFLRALEEADGEKRASYETVPPRKEGRAPYVGDEMVLLKGKPEVGFKLIKEEIHNEAAEAAAEGMTRGL
ncbi:putative lipid metabolism-related protein [Leucosporidium creatinivorum]|uniref:Putative lipid metabolism-related protein n=1 Tax=Leucosporidium creatinivorum TaxID=106004 RepID=A0A1Y2F735_9BASI|nr:putative lipid metabolism-related protein [Leucosporidium creatinivorum]